MVSSRPDRAMPWKLISTKQQKRKKKSSPLKYYKVFLDALFRYFTKISFIKILTVLTFKFLLIIFFLNSVLMIMSSKDLDTPSMPYQVGDIP